MDYQTPELFEVGKALELTLGRKIGHFADEMSGRFFWRIIPLMPLEAVGEEPESR